MYTLHRLSAEDLERMNRNNSIHDESSQNPPLLIIFIHNHHHFRDIKGWSWESGQHSEWVCDRLLYEINKCDEEDTIITTITTITNNNTTTTNTTTNITKSRELGALQFVWNDDDEKEKWSASATCSVAFPWLATSLYCNCDCPPSPLLMAMRCLFYSPVQYLFILHF